MKKRSLRRTKSAKREHPRERRAMPAIFVATPADAQLGLGKHAQAHIRTRSGGYRYLVWREGDQVREISARSESPPYARSSLEDQLAGAVRTSAAAACRAKKGLQDET